jgi:hypothetical protein
MGLERVAVFGLTTMKIIAEYFGRGFDLGNGVFGIQPILISPIHSVILPQGKLDGTS